MCGICGIVHSPSSGRQVPRDLLERMRDTLTHRGPDDAGIHLGKSVGLGHRRLSIVDLEGGHQPMGLDDRPLHIVYNGEVYNHPELRSWLEGRGHRYRTRCDTESVLRTCAEEGREGIRRLRGMFAFAIWDEEAGELLLARDRLGIKPLYYVHQDDGSLYFASEIKALIEAGAVQPALNYRALPDYLANHAPSGEETLFEGVRRLLPGHTLVWRDGKISIRAYWSLEACPEPVSGNDDALVAEFAARLEESIRIRLMADVPLGVFLSGGIDSAAIASIMADLADGPISTFSVAFQEREANELYYARMVADDIGSRHHEVMVSPEEFFGVLPRLTWHEDEPLAHPGSVPLHFVSALAARHSKVVLTGEGSDELLGGYGRYWKTRLNLDLGIRYRGAAPKALRRIVAEGVSALGGTRIGKKLERTFLALEPDLENLYTDNFAVFPRRAQNELLTPRTRALAGAGGPYALLRPLFREAEGCSLLQQLLFVDLQTYLQELLMKQDQMSMSTSLESRVPFLDHPLVEFASRLPDRMKLRRWTPKYILRQAVAHRLPAPILSRRKMGFPVPFGRWVREGRAPLVDRVLLDGRFDERGLFRPGVARELLEEHRTSGRDRSMRIWSLLGLELWHRTFIDGEPVVDPDLAVGEIGSLQ